MNLSRLLPYLRASANRCVDAYWSPVIEPDDLVQETLMRLLPYGDCHIGYARAALQNCYYNMIRRALAKRRRLDRRRPILLDDRTSGGIEPIDELIHREDLEAAGEEYDGTNACRNRIMRRLGLYK